MLEDPRTARENVRMFYTHGRVVKIWRTTTQDAYKKGFLLEGAILASEAKGVLTFFPTLEYHVLIFLSNK